MQENEIKIDNTTVNLIIHKLAGRLTNIKGAAQFIIEDHADKNKWAEIIKRDSQAITDILKELQAIS